MHGLTQDVKQEARRLGFDLVGIASPDPSSHMVRYRDWLARGYCADMDYLARPDAVEKRSDPRILMPGVRSVVVVGMNYYPGDFPPGEAAQGRVARYAWGADYHSVLLKRLERLADQTRAWVSRSIDHRAYVDFGPVMERELAQRAGLGWIGKNTSLIHPSMGSYVFLGELLLDVELEPDAALFDDRCGSCTACLEACPTGALVAPRVLDARRCISYLTIEHRGAIPEPHRASLGDWVFGCDVCQEVCPWNRRFARPTTVSAFAPARPRLDLVELLRMTKGAFHSRFHDTPLWRPRRAGLLRNAAVVLGNIGGPSVVPVLEEVCLDESNLVRTHAEWALGQVRLA